MITTNGKYPKSSVSQIFRNGYQSPDGDLKTQPLGTLYSATYL